MTALKFRLENGNSGIYSRARKRGSNEPKADPLIGTQADFDDSGRWTGVIMEYLLREVLAERGQVVTIDETGQKQIAPTPLQDPAVLLNRVKKGDGMTTGYARKGSASRCGSMARRCANWTTRTPENPARLAGTPGSCRSTHGCPVQGHRVYSGCDPSQLRRLG